jgi:uncharacterized protein (TIGR03083 family)
MNDLIDDHQGLSNPEPIIVVDLFQETLDHLLEFLTGLNEEDWNAPTICTGWCVKDVALHLLGVEIGNISSRRDQHNLERAIENWDELVEFVNRWNKEWVKVSRRISSPLLIELLECVGEDACAYFRSLDPFEIGGSISWVGPEPRPVWLDIAREYTERWHHQQHIRDAVNKPGLKEPKYLRPVLATFVWALPHAFRNVVAPDGMSITLTISGESGGGWTLLRQKSRWGFYRGEAIAPDAEIILDEEMAWRYFTRGFEPHQAREIIKIKGNKRFAEPFFRAVAIIA